VQQAERRRIQKPAVNAAGRQAQNRGRRNGGSRPVNARQKPNHKQAEQGGQAAENQQVRRQVRGAEVKPSRQAGRQQAKRQNGGSSGEARPQQQAYTQAGRQETKRTQNGNLRGRIRNEAGAEVAERSCGR